METQIGTTYLKLNRIRPANIWDIFPPEKLLKTRDLSMEVCNLKVEKAPFGVCNDCYTSVVFG